MIDKNIAVSYKVTIDSNTYTVRDGVDSKFIYSEDLDAPIKYFPLNTIFINNRTSNPESFIVGVLTVDLNTNDIKFDGISTNNRFGSSNREVAIALKDEPTFYPYLDRDITNVTLEIVELDTEELPEDPSTRFDLSSALMGSQLNTCRVMYYRMDT